MKENEWTERALQIGVIGSMADLGYSKNIEQQARTLGEAITKAGCILIFGAEKDSDSLSTVAARAAQEKGGMTIGITYGKGLDVFDRNAATAVIATGMERGGGRELVQALSCDGLVAIGGGSGTLNELTVAYQAGIPVVLISGTGGWSDALSGMCLDNRNRYQYVSSDNPAEAVRILLEQIRGRSVSDK